MRKVRKKTILDRIDDSINDKIDEIKEKNREKKLSNKKKNIQTIDSDEKIEKKNFKSKDKNNNIKAKKNDKYIKDDNEIDDFFDEVEDVIKDEDFEEDNEILKGKSKKDIVVKNKDKKKKKFDEENDILKEDNKPKKKKIFAFLKKKEKNVEKKKDIPNKKNNKKIKEIDDKTKKKRPLWKKILTVFLILCIIGVLSVTAFLGYVVITAPEFTDSALLIKDQTVIYDIDGNIIAKLGSEKRESVTYDALPQVLIDAIIATEDSRFFQHNGVDLFRFIKATIQQLMGHDDAGGASTLTMQTVKNNITKMDKQEDDSNLKGKIKKVVRKFQDVYLAVFKVEKEYSKEEILEMYCNDNFLGGSYYGVEEASKYYFGKSVSELTLPEASLIAGLFQAPGRHNPYVDIDKATARRTTVLKLMVRHGYITEEERKLAEKVPIESLLVGRSSGDTKYQGYIDTVVAEVEKITDHGDGTGGDNPYTVPMKIYTTMETKIQDGINGIFDDPNNFENEKAQAGIAVINAETGAIAAVGAGRNKTGERQFNYATQAYRQPGSTAKPIFDYGPAIEYLNYSSGTLIVDEPWSYTNGPAVNNWNYSYDGLQTVRHHLQVSRNIPALKTFQAVGPRNSQKFVASLGLDVSLNSSSENYHVFDNGLDNTINEAYSIGGAAKGFTPLEMAVAYACFANGGYYTEPHTVTKIIYRETGDEKEYKYTKERVMKDSTAYIMNNILESAVSGGGFAGGAKVDGSHVAAKTGTSNYTQEAMRKYGLPSGAVNDLWTVAYTSQYAVSVWYGYDEINSQYYNTSDWWKNLITSKVFWYIPKDTKGWTMPSSVVGVSTERGTVPAALASEYTPADMRTATEYYVRGTQPTEVSERFQKLNDVTNLKSSKNGNKVTLTWDFETPRVLTREYIENYFNKPTFGNSKATYVNERLDYNSKVLGDVGFAIYKQQENGSLTLVDFVKTKSYEYTGYGNTTLVVKAEHANFKSNASNGVKINLSLDDLNINKLEATFYSNGPIVTSAGNYEEKGFRSITYDGIDIKKNVTITYSISGSGITGNSETYNDPTEFENYVNTLSPGTYTISYVINYLGNNITKTRKLILS